jgi:toxin-antitoxin system PIN domain toxin
MVLVDVNLLIHAIHSASPDHAAAKTWLDDRLQSGEPLGLPWAVLVGFVRITTNPRITSHPFTLDESLQQIRDWLETPGVQILHPTAEHERHFADLCRAAGAVGNLVTDAHLAALAIEHDCELGSNDTDFSRFPGLRWVNPLA